VKKQKTIKPFYFKHLSDKELIDILNKELPINLKNHSDLIDRIYIKYPLVSKTEISTIIISIFQSIRELLVLGKILNFNNIFFDTKLHFFDHTKNNITFPALKVKISTPPPLRKSYEK